MTQVHRSIEPLVQPAAALLRALDRDDGRGLVAHWRDGASLGEHADAARAVAARFAQLTQSRESAEATAAALPRGLADLALVWAESAAARDDLALSSLLTGIGDDDDAPARRRALRQRAAAARVSRGPLFDALHALPAVWDADALPALRPRIDQLVWEAGARAMSFPALGRWAWATPTALRALVLEPSRGHLGQRVLAARALGVLGEGFVEEGSTGLTALVLDVIRQLITHTDPLVWTATARATGRITAAMPSARVLVFRMASSERRSHRRRIAAAIAALPLSVGAEHWVERQLDAILDDDARKDDPWHAASLGIAAPHLARERPEAWDRICRIALAAPSLELSWTLAQGLAMLGRRGAGRGWTHGEETFVHELRTKLATIVAGAPVDASRQTDALVQLDRAMGEPPPVVHCLDEHDQLIRARVDGRELAASPTSPRAAFDAAARDLDDADVLARGRAQLSLRAATRTHAMHLSELLELGPVRASDGDHMRVIAGARLAAETCEYGLRATLVGALADLCDAFPVHTPGTGHGRASARALRAVAGACWVQEVALDDADDRKKQRREVQRFRKPLEDMFNTCLAARPALATQRDAATVPPAIAAWWALCAGSAAVLGVIEGSAELAQHIRALEDALRDGALGARVDAWAPRARAAITALGAGDTALAAAFDRLADALRPLDARADLGPDEATDHLDALGHAVAAIQTVGDDLDDALAPGATRLVTGEHAAVDGPGAAWLLGDGGSSPTMWSGADQRSLTERCEAALAPPLRAIVVPIARALTERAAQRSRFELAAGVALGPYVLVSKLGHGGMGEVWKAKRGRQPVALKIPHLDASASYRGELADALRAEADNLEPLAFAKVATFLDAGVIDGLPYLATSYVRGRTVLEHLIEDPSAQMKGVHLPLARRIVHDVCIGLDNLHRHGVVHRDLKPNNIMLRMRGTDADPIRALKDDPIGRDIDEAVLIDFGVAHRFNAAGGKGYTLGYAAPEVIAHDPVGPAADVYALGATVFHLLTRQLLCGSRPSDAAMVWHLDAEPFEDPFVQKATAGIDKTIVDALASACRREPDQRITVEEFRARFTDDR